MDGKWITAKNLDSQEISKKATNRLAIPYIWQFSVNNNKYYGRSLRDFYIFCRDKLNKAYPDRKIVWVHNLSYEFSFLCQDFRFTKVFSRKPGDIIFCYCKELNIEFRCSYKLAMMKLAYLPSSFPWITVKKLVGELDYDIARLPCTPLSESEMAYCENDIEIVYQYIKGLKEHYSYSCIADIPYTQTGIIRRIIRTQVLNSSSHMKHMFEIKPDLSDYKWITRVLRGGVTQCQWVYLERKLNNLFHVDIESSYPFVMVTEFYPDSKWEYGNTDPHNSDYLYIYHIILYDIEPKSPWNYISFSKTEKVKPKLGESYNECVTEGRVNSASMVEMYCLDVDLEIIKMVYDVGEIKYIEYKRSRKKRLPIALIKYILNSFCEKTAIKGIKELKAKYTFTKQELNGIFGMALTNIFKDEPIFDGFNLWHMDKMDDDRLESKLNKDKPFLNFSWGLYVPAYARKRLFTLIMKMPLDSVYTDTDSIFFRNEDNFKYIDELNVEVLETVKNVAGLLDLDIRLFMPKDSRGKKHLIGSWSREDDVISFKCCGSKKYCMETKEDGFTAIVAGCVKKYYDFDLNEYIPTIKSFDEFYIDEDNPAQFKNGRSVAWHTSTQPPVVLIDYLGNKYRNDQLCGIVILNTNYTLGLTAQLNEFLDTPHNGYTNPFRSKL